MSTPTATGHRISSNENPYPAPPAVRQAIREATDRVNRYPSVYPDAVAEAVARHHRVPVDHVAVGAGSSGLIQQMLHLAARAGGEAVIAWRSFEGYPVIAEAMGVPVRRVPLRVQEQDLPAMARAVRRRTKLVFLGNPTNPTGTGLPRAALAEFLNRVPRRVFVVLDEVYRDFATDPNTADGLECYPEHPNVVVLRSLSKGYGLADLRVGYALGQPGPISALRSITMPFLLSGMAQSAAVAALEAEQEYRVQRSAIVAERDRMVRALRSAGLDVSPSEGNFVWLPLGAASAGFVAACAAGGVQVRPFAPEGVRVSIGTAQTNDLLLSIVRTWADGR